MAAALLARGELRLADRSSRADNESADPLAKFAHVSPTFLPCPILRDGKQVRSETVVYETGARGLTFITTSAELETQLYSSYLGDELLDLALVAEAFQRPGTSKPRLSSREVALPAGFLPYQRSTALTDHLDRLVELCGGEGIELVLGEVERAARVLAPASA